MKLGVEYCLPHRETHSCGVRRYGVNIRHLGLVRDCLLPEQRCVPMGQASGLVGLVESCAVVHTRGACSAGARLSGEFVLAAG